MVNVFFLESRMGVPANCDASQIVWETDDLISAEAQ